MELHNAKDIIFHFGSYSLHNLASIFLHNSTCLLSYNQDMFFFLRSMDIFLRSMIDYVNDLVDRNKENIIFFLDLQLCALQTANGDAGLIVSGLFHKKQIGLFMAQTLNAKNRMVFWPLWQV